MVQPPRSNHTHLAQSLTYGTPSLHPTTPVTNTGSARRDLPAGAGHLVPGPPPPAEGALLTLDALAEPVQALQRAALAQLGRRPRLLHSSHREGLLQRHHDLIHLVGEERDGSQRKVQLTRAGSACRTRQEDCGL